jgi:hypothetical protein
MHEQESLPRARKDDLLEETVGEELLLYDQNSHTAHCLSPIAACVWRHCDGEHDATELAELAGASENLVADALHELREKDLLDAKPTLTQSTIPGESRREAIGRVARYGAAAAAGSLIVSATAATPAMASSGEEELLVGNYECGGVSTKNCCDCAEVCIYNSPKNKLECETACKNKYGGYVNWKANAVCVKV